MTPRTAWRLFGALMFWTVVTSLFAWLPLVRIIGRPEGYTWAILGLSGSGTDGPFWIFAALTAYVLVMLRALVRGPRRLSYALVLPWHVLVTAVILVGVIQGGAGAALQGQGLRFEIPLWVLAFPFVAFTGVVVAWVIADRQTGGTPVAGAWTRRNTVHLTASLALLGVALALFRAGTNYNWVTALAIVATVAHWIALVRSFGNVPAPEGVR